MIRKVQFGTRPGSLAFAQFAALADRCVPIVELSRLGGKLCDTTCNLVDAALRDAQIYRTFTDTVL